MNSLATGRALLIQVKAAAGSPGPSLCLPVGQPCQALLRPVATQPARLNPGDIRRLTEWRNRFVTSFLTEFTATEERTAHWLTNAVGPDDTRILFMLDDLQGRTFGYMGIGYICWDTRYGEADAIVRGEEAPSGTMSVALRTLLAWARGQLGLKNLCVRVRSDNSALQFYSKLGFQEVKRVPLNCTVSKAGRDWFEDPALNQAKASLVYMKYAA